MVLLEAMSASMAIVATAVGSIPEVITHGQQGLLVPPKQPDQLASALQRLIDNPTLGQQLADNAHAHWQHDYSMPPMVAKLQQLHHEVY